MLAKAIIQSVLTESEAMCSLCMFDMRGNNESTSDRRTSLVDESDTHKEEDWLHYNPIIRIGY